MRRKPGGAFLNNMFRSHYADVQRMQGSEAMRFDELESWSGGANRQGTVAELECVGVVGFMLFTYARPGLVLHDLRVDERFRGRGYGGQLLRQLILTRLGRDYQRIAVVRPIDDLEGMRFLQHFGFRVEATGRDLATLELTRHGYQGFLVLKSILEGNEAVVS